MANAEGICWEGEKEEEEEELIEEQAETEEWVGRTQSWPFSSKELSVSSWLASGQACNSFLSDRKTVMVHAGDGTQMHTGAILRMTGWPSPEAALPRVCTALRAAQCYLRAL